MKEEIFLVYVNRIVSFISNKLCTNEVNIRGVVEDNYRTI